MPEANRKLHSAYSQIKVFKTKGADRKNKTDREKAQKTENKVANIAFIFFLQTERFFKLLSIFCK